jgi:hypothetical protein
MNAVIKVKASELNVSLLERIKTLIADNKDAEVTISVVDKRAEYFEELDRSIKNLEAGNVISFSMEDLEQYSAKNRP